ncbi:unnamed protein product [Caenorhabditis angaria]|uniref:Glutathione S-transferase n=1 Tax=Caenorhabditis angaria TaxID=860376 RepID=A0A9P1N652_9PELO|nr:unnamed protein product [Caenorhabditis angaria]
MSPDQKHTYKLFYVNARGRAEPIRLIFHYFNVDFEDYRMEKEEFGEAKEKAPMHQLPYMELDGGKTTLCQTLAMCRYLGKSIQPERWFGGATKTDSAKVDMFADAFCDLFNLAMNAVYADEKIKEFQMESFKAAIGPKLKIQENLLKKSKGDYFVGKSIHWCDVYILGILQALDELQDGIFDDLPELTAYYLRMRNLPELRDYISQNWPATKYE